MKFPRGRLAVVVVLIVVGYVAIAAAMAAGKPSRPAAAGVSACDTAVAAAAAYDDNSDTIEQLDPALRACTSLADLQAASAKYPKAFDGVDPAEFARNRCASSSAPTGAAICQLVK